MAALLPQRWRPILERVSEADVSPACTDKDFAELAKFRHLISLDVKGEQLTDDGIAGISTFTGLQTLHISYPNNVSDKGLAPLASLTQLRTLWLECPRISGSGLVCLSRLQNLEELYLCLTDDGSDFDGRNLVCLAPLKNLRTLWIMHVRLRDNDLAPLAALTNLRGLALRFNGISDAALAHLIGLQKLDRLDIRETTLTDRGAASLAQLPSLRQLDVDRSRLRISQAGITHLQALPHLNEIHVHGGFLGFDDVLSPDQIGDAVPVATPSPAHSAATETGR